MFITLKDLKSIHSGVKKAKRDWKLIQQHEVDHKRLHEADSEWSCGQFNHDFYQHRVAQDIDPLVDPYESVAYARYAKQKKLEQDLADAKEESESRKPGDFTPILIEVDGNESQEDMIAKVRAAFETQETLDKIEFPETQTDDEKGGK